MISGLHAHIRRFTGINGSIPLVHVLYTCSFNDGGAGVFSLLKVCFGEQQDMALYTRLH